MKVTEQLLAWHNKSLGRYEPLMCFNSKGEYFPKLKSVPGFMPTKKPNMQSMPNKHVKSFKAYLNHPAFWTHLSKIIIHCNSKRLIEQSAYYGGLNLALTCIGTQTPCLIKSKKSVAVFKMFKNSPMGAVNNLRNKNIIGFCYKWTFLCPFIDLKNPTNFSLPNLLFIPFKEGQSKGQKNSIGIKNVLAFPELNFNYQLFQSLSGLEIGFQKKNVVPAPL
jgi:ribosomal protein L5